MPIDQLNSDIGGLLKVISFLIGKLEGLEQYCMDTDPLVSEHIKTDYIERAKVREGIKKLSHDPGYDQLLMSVVILGEQWEE